MTDAHALRRLALALDGAQERPHFDRASFRVRRIFVTLAPDSLTANFVFAPDEQALKCAVAPDAFSPVPNAWGRRGATTGALANLSEQELAAALQIAWRHAAAKVPTR